MSSVYVLIDRPHGEVSEAALGLLTLAGQWGDPVAIVLSERASDEGCDRDSAGIEPSEMVALSRAGAVEIIVARPVGVSPESGCVVHSGELMTDAATAALSERRTAAELADVVLASGTPEGREIAGRLAVRLKAAVITDVVALLPVTSDSGFRVKKTALADAFEVIVRSTRRAAVIVVAPEVASAVWAKTCETAVFRDVVPRVRPLKCPLRMGTSAIRVVERRARDMSERPDLSKAKVVVAGGRGTRGDFTSIEALADALGGATAASWAAVSAGWCSADRQVGQTGQRVSPRLYVAAGISGSVHHRVGMQDSQVVVAVNKDPDAPIFGIADFGIVGDLFTVLPQAVEEIARIRGRIGT